MSRVLFEEIYCLSPHVYSEYVVCVLGGNLIEDTFPDDRMVSQ